MYICSVFSKIPNDNLKFPKYAELLCQKETHLYSSNYSENASRNFKVLSNVYNIKFKVNKEKKETKEHYRSILRLVKEQTQYESGWNEASSKVKSISSQIDLLDVIIKAENFDFVAELEKLTAEHIDWPKLGESWMDD